MRNARLDYIGANALGRALYAPVFDSPEQPANSARFTFLDPAAADFYPDWDRVATELVAHLRSEAGRNPYDRQLSDLVDWIDLYQIHRPDPQTDYDETLGALTDLVQQGKVRYIGSSSFNAGQIVEAQWTARDRNLQRFRTEQPPYSLLVRGIELDVLPTAQRHGMGILTYSPLAGGWLSGSWTADSAPTSPARQRLVARFDMSLPENQRKFEAVEQLAEVADGAGVTMIELAIAFVVNHPGVTSAIVGPRTMEQLESQLPAADVELDVATLDRIDAIVRPGVNLNPADTSYGEQVLEPALRRR